MMLRTLIYAVAVGVRIEGITVTNTMN